MRVLSKVLRVCGLVVLLLAGWAGILTALLVYISSKVPVSLFADGRVSTHAWDSGYVFARGTWTIEGHGHGFPLNSSEIQCVRDERRCYAANGRVWDRYLTAELERYEIRKWDDSTLEFVTGTPCVTYLYVINRGTEKLTGRRQRKDAPSDICPSVLEPDLKLAFVDGLSVTQSLERKHAPTELSLLAAAGWFIFIVAWMVRIVRQ